LQRKREKEKMLRLIQNINGVISMQFAQGVHQKRQTGHKKKGKAESWLIGEKTNWKEISEDSNSIRGGGRS